MCKWHVCSCFCASADAFSSALNVSSSGSVVRLFGQLHSFASRQLHTGPAWSPQLACCLSPLHLLLMLLLAEPSFFPLSFSSLGCDIFESRVRYLCIFGISASALRSNEQTPDGCFSPSSLGPAFPIQHQNFLSGTRSVPSSLSAAPVSCQGEI